VSSAPAGQAPATLPGTDGGHRALLHLGAVTGVAGLVVQVVSTLLHPSGAQPNDSDAAFREYAAFGGWELVHIGQWLGVVLVVVALVVLARALAGQSGVAGAFAVPGMVVAVLVAAVFTVQMAVDGVALRAAIDTWLGTVPDGADAAFGVAEGVRDLEKGLSAFFHLLNGSTLLLLGLAMACGRAAPRWLGGVGVLAGLGYLAGGVVTAYTGFSPTAGTVLLVPLALGVVFVLGGCAWMWRLR
jgi:hypothetical protein